MERLAGKVAIVTGAARGTGEAIARRFVAEGARVWLGDVLDELGAKVAAELGAAAHYLRHDVTSEEQWQRVVSSALDAHGRIDVLVNNAAVLHIGTLDHTPPASSRRSTGSRRQAMAAAPMPRTLERYAACVTAADVDGIGAVCAAAGEAAVPMRARIRRDGRLLEIDVIDVVCFDPQGRLTSLRAFFDLAGARAI